MPGPVPAQGPSRSSRNDECEDENGGVEVRVQLDGDGKREPDAQDEVDQKHGENYPDRPADHRKHRGLGHEAADQTTPPRAERQAHSEFAPPALRPRQEETGQVDARNEEQEDRDAHDQAGYRYHGRVDRGVNGRGQDGRGHEGAACVAIPMRRDQGLRKRTECRVSLGQGRAICQASLDHERLDAAPLQTSRAVQGELVGHGRGRPEVRLQSPEDPAEIALGDSRDRVRIPVEAHAAADHTGIGPEPVPPVRIAEHQYGIRPGLHTLRGCEHPADLGAYAQHLKVRTGHEFDEHVVPPAAVVAETGLAERHPGHSGKHGARGRFHFAEGDVREGAEGVPGLDEPDIDQFLRVFVTVADGAARSRKR